MEEIRKIIKDVQDRESKDYRIFKGTVKEFFDSAAQWVKPRNSRRVVMSGVIKKGKKETRTFAYDSEFLSRSQERQERQVREIQENRY